LSAGALRVVGVMHRHSDDDRVDFFLACRLDDDSEPQNREPGKCSELVWSDIAELPADTVPYVRAGIDNFRRGFWFQEFGWCPRRRLRSLRWAGIVHSWASSVARAYSRGSAWPVSSWLRAARGPARRPASFPFPTSPATSSTSTASSRGRPSSS